MDSGTIAAIVALFVAAIALLVAFAQVAQQYIATSDLIRKCDSTVYGPLPGKGRRVWKWRQMRFKVFYASLHISLTAELWPEMYRASCGESDRPKDLLPTRDYSAPTNLELEPGQASWALFYRVVERSCYHDLRHQMLAGDADLCPSDLPVIPIQVSLRDVIVMAFMNGMVVTYACPYPTKVISMQGSAGALSGAEHPILGTIVHFTPQRITGNYGVTLNGKINNGWMHRLVADCRVAGRDFTPFERDHTEESEGRWMRRLIQKVETTEPAWGYRTPPESPSAAYSNPFAPRPGQPVTTTAYSNPFAPPDQPVTTTAYSNPFAPRPGQPVTTAYAQPPKSFAAMSVDPALPEFPNPFLPLRRNTEDIRAKPWASGDSAVHFESGGDSYAPIQESKSTSTELIPWRKPWAIEAPKDPTHFVLIPFQSARQGSQSIPDCETTAPTRLPEAPDAPLNLALVPGVNDGSWNFSFEKNHQVVLISPVAFDPSHERVTKHHWFLWLQNLLMGKGKDADEKAPFLPVFQTTVNSGWRIMKGQRVILRFIPVPESEDTDLSASTNDSQLFSPPVPLPPDFLDSRLQLDWGRGIQSPIRSYRAIAQQQNRRITQEQESRDLRLLKAGPTRQLLEAPPHATDLPNTSCRALAERFDIQNVPKAKPFYFRKWRKSQRRIQQRPAPLMIEARGSNDDGGDNSESQKAASSRRNLSAYVESVASEDDRSLLGTGERILTSSKSESSPPPSPHPLTSSNKSYSRSPSPPHQRRRKRAMTSENKDYESDWGSSTPNPRRVLGRHTKHPASGTSKSKRVNFMEGVTAGDSTDSDSEDWEKVRSDYSSLNSRSVTNSGRSNSDDDRSVASRDSITSQQKSQWRQQIEAEIQASRRERMRETERHWRKLKRQQRVQRPSVLTRRKPDDLSWFWVCQMDIIPGYWATPWTLEFSPYVSLGTTAVILEALLGLTDDLCLQYSPVHQEGTWSWLREGKTTFPPYARNARGGVIVGGSYEAVCFHAFEQKLPPIQLLHCYDYQVSKCPRVDDVSVLGRQLELMAIDSWLSAAGRTSEVMDGAANLLRTTPALVGKLMQEFGYDFGGLDFTATEGGLQVIQNIVEELMDTFEDEALSEAEQIFILVSLLRTAKVALCISLGPSTEQVREFLTTDIQVFMV